MDRIPSDETPCFRVKLLVTLCCLLCLNAGNLYSLFSVRLGLLEALISQDINRPINRESSCGYSLYCKTEAFFVRKENNSTKREHNENRSFASPVAAQLGWRNLPRRKHKSAARSIQAKQRKASQCRLDLYLIGSINGCFVFLLLAIRSLVFLLFSLSASIVRPSPS